MKQSDLNFAEIHAVPCDERKPWQVHFSLVINRSNLHESTLIFSILNNFTFVLLANYDLKPQLWHFVMWKGIALYSPLKKLIIHLQFYSVEVGYSNIWVLVVVSDWLVAGFVPVSKVRIRLIALLNMYDDLEKCHKVIRTNLTCYSIIRAAVRCTATSNQFNNKVCCDVIKLFMGQLNSDDLIPTAWTCESNLAHITAIKLFQLSCNIWQL